MSRPRKKKGRPVSGWLILDKPVGMGSTDAVSKVKWLFKAEKAGHAGTLDPLASGMLPIALGEATKTVPYVMDGAKIYRFTVAWGEERSTDDLEGEPTSTSPERPTEDAIRAIMPNYTGVIMQVPPRFSAIKIGGERAYDLARAGEQVEIEAREIEIGRLDLVERPDDSRAVFEVAPFEPDDLVTIEELEAAQGAAPDSESFEALDDLLVDTIVALDDLPSVALGDEAAQRVRSGNPVVARGRDAPVEAPEAYATQRGKLVAIGMIEAGMFKPKRVFTAQA